MEEIKVGEYVRTRTQGIKRIDTINENRPVNRYGYEIGSEWDGKLYSTIKTTDILKHSFNIIDLIEVGDIIVYEKWEEIYKKEVEDVGNKCVYVYKDTVYEDEIKSIVTKEMFLNAEYRVETN